MKCSFNRLIPRLHFYTYLPLFPYLPNFMFSLLFFWNIETNFDYQNTLENRAYFKEITLFNE